MPDKRRFHRVLFDSLVEFESGDCEHVCELIDISLNGALIAACSGATPAPGTPCTLILNLDEEHENQIIMVGSIAHKVENRVGIRCNSIDSESMTNLRRLVEYNLGDVELVHRELEMLVHEH